MLRAAAVGLKPVVLNREENFATGTVELEIPRALANGFKLVPIAEAQ